MISMSALSKCVEPSLYASTGFLFALFGVTLEIAEARNSYLKTFCI